MRGLRLGAFLPPSWNYQMNNKLCFVETDGSGFVAFGPELEASATSLICQLEDEHSDPVEGGTEKTDRLR